MARFELNDRLHFAILGRINNNVKDGAKIIAKRTLKYLPIVSHENGLLKSPVDQITINKLQVMIVRAVIRGNLSKFIV